jgi:hypothetical protein
VASKAGFSADIIGPGIEEMSENGVIGGLPIDFNLSEAYLLKFPLLSEWHCDVGFENSRRVFFKAVPAEQSSPSDIQQPIHQPESVRGEQALKGKGIVGAESKRMLRPENPVDFTQAETPFFFGIYVVYPVEGEQNIVEALAIKHERAGIHDPEINAFHQLAGHLNHLRNNVNTSNGMSHSLEKKACSPATTADVKNCSGLREMPIEDSLFHGEKIELAVLL